MLVPDFSDCFVEFELGFVGLVLEVELMDLGH